jgi:hypothetical protein
MAKKNLKKLQVIEIEKRKKKRALDTEGLERPGQPVLIYLNRQITS